MLLKILDILGEITAICSFAYIMVNVFKAQL